MCILEKILDGSEPSLERVLLLCAEQERKENEKPAPIGFQR